MVYGTNYRDVLLIDAEDAASDQTHIRKLFRLSARHRSSTSGTGHCALLRLETAELIGPERWPANSRDLNPVDYRIRGLIQERVYRHQCETLMT